MERTTTKTTLVGMDDKMVERIGNRFAEGVVTTLAKWFVIGLLVLLAGGAIADGMGWGFDGTDDRAAGRHSGMRLRTDHGTGCQYLETSGGGITPRLTREGKHYCN